VEACLPGAWLDVRRTTRDGHRPEKTAVAKPWVEVVDLVRKVRGRRPLEHVESDEPEGGVLLAAGKVDVLALHDPHVGVEGEVGKLTLANTACVGGRDEAVEIEDRGLSPPPGRLIWKWLPATSMLPGIGLGAPGVPLAAAVKGSPARRAVPPTPAAAPAMNDRLDMARSQKC